MGNVCGTSSFTGLDSDGALQVFTALDYRNHGYLTLRELMSTSSPGLIMPHSLPAIFFIDEQKNGRITREQFTSFLKFCQQEKEKAYDSACRDKKFRDVISRASAAGVRDCSVPCRTSFRRFRSYSNVRSLFCRRPSEFNLLARSFIEAGAETEDTSVTEGQSLSCAPCDQGQYPGQGLESNQSKRPEDEVLQSNSVHFASAHEYPCAPCVPCPSLSESSYMDATDQLSGKIRKGTDAKVKHHIAENSEIVWGKVSDDTCVADSEMEHIVANKAMESGQNDGHDSSSSDSGYDSDDEGATCNREEAPEYAAPHASVCEVLEPLTAQCSTAMDAAVTESIAEMNIHKLADLLHAEGWREQFMQWLWKLVDFNSTGIVTLEELQVFLDALSEDGIDLEELAFYKDSNIPLVECIINEFDTTHTGALQQDEFMVLADLVTREYAHWESRHLDRVGDYELGRTVGRGSSGIVRMGVHVQSHDKFAVKIIRKGKCADMSCVDREIQALKVAKHEHIVALEEVLETEDNVFLVLELCGGGSLSDVLRLYPEERMTERTARFYLRQVFEALCFCHEHGICHRDVRLDNLLLDNRGMIKVTDFGHCKVFPGRGWDYHATMLVGSIHNLSPEQVAGQVYSGEKIDIWSCGVAVYSLLVGHPPFMDQDCVKLLENISKGTFEIPSFVSAEAADLIRCMIRVCPNERIPLSQLMEHPWFYAGDSYGPDMDIYSIPVDPFFMKRPDLAEMIMAGTIHEHNLHFHLADTLNPKSPPEDLRGQAWSLKCLCPQMDIKFSVSLFTREPTTLISPNRLQNVSVVTTTQGVSSSQDFDSSGDDGNQVRERTRGSSSGSHSDSDIGRRRIEAERSRPCESESDDESIRYVFDEDSARDEFGQSRRKHLPKRSLSLDEEAHFSRSYMDYDHMKQVAEFTSNPSVLFDAFPYQKVFPRREMPEATKKFDSDRRIAAAAAESVARNPAIATNLQRSATIEGVSSFAGRRSAERGRRKGIKPSACITRGLEKYPAKGHSSQSPMPHTRANIGAPVTKTVTQSADECVLLPSSYAENVEGLSLNDMNTFRRRVGCVHETVPVLVTSDFQPYIEVRLQCGESGLFRRICHKLKTICDTKLAAAAESQRRRSASRRTASASISEFRRSASSRSIAFA